MFFSFAILGVLTCLLLLYGCVWCFFAWFSLCLGGCIFLDFNCYLNVCVAVFSFVYDLRVIIIVVVIRCAWFVFLQSVRRCVVFLLLSLTCCLLCSLCVVSFVCVILFCLCVCVCFRIGVMLVFVSSSQFVSLV